MSQNLSPQSPMRPLSVGNVVSAGLRLYRSQLKTYFQLALYASLWSLVPVYGWAKASAIAALISRLAFGELINQPESVNSARSQVNPRMWKFFLTGILVSLILYGCFIGLYIVLAIGIGLSVGIALTVGQSNPLAILLVILLGILILVAFLAGITWIYSRLMLAEVPLAIEDNLTATTTVSRSWELTKGFVLRIQGIILVAFLISFPLFLIAQLGALAIQEGFATVLPRQSAAIVVASFLGGYILGLISNIFLMPFWQAIKAVIYYDLRTRREGLDLQLRDRSI